MDRFLRHAFLVSLLAFGLALLGADRSIEASSGTNFGDPESRVQHAP